MPRPIAEQVVVLTGASSGIGRATALEMARRRTSLVLASRSAAGLEAVAEQARGLGSVVQVVVTDITRQQDVERLAAEAVDRFERIDTWVNNAGGTAFGTIEQMPVGEIEAQVQLGLLGPAYGIKAVLPQMRRQGYGTIVNVGSALSNRAVPLQGGYCAAKHGLRGLNDALRLELRRERGRIATVLVLPVAVDTDYFENATSYLPAPPTPIPPVYPPEAVARAIVRAAEKPRAYMYVGWRGRVMGLLQGISPGLLDWYMVQGDRFVRLQQAPRRDDSSGVR